MGENRGVRHRTASNVIVWLPRVSQNGLLVKYCPRLRHPSWRSVSMGKAVGLLGGREVRWHSKCLWPLRRGESRTVAQMDGVSVLWGRPETLAKNSTASLVLYISNWIFFFLKKKA